MSFIKKNVPTLKLNNNYYYCSDTVSRSDVYCAVSNAIEQCKTEGVVDVFQVTKAWFPLAPLKVPETCLRCL